MGSHGWSPVAVNDQLVRIDLLFFDCFLDQLLGQMSPLSMSKHPADGVATVDVDDRVEIVIGPFFWSFELGDIPRPYFVGAGGQQFGFPVFGVS